MSESMRKQALAEGSGTMQSFNNPCATRIFQGQCCIQRCTALEPSLDLGFLIVAAEKRFCENFVKICNISL